jgi:hypothetical protein
METINFFGLSGVGLLSIVLLGSLVVVHHSSDIGKYS